MKRLAAGPIGTRAPHGGARQSGFTLIELVVALSIAVILLATAPAALNRAYEAMEYRATIRNMLAGLKAARLEAARDGRPVSFQVDLEGRRFGFGERMSAAIPESIDVRVVVAEREIRDGRAGIRFYPDGSATGGSIELVRPSGDGLRLRIDWLLGRVSQEPLGV